MEIEAEGEQNLRQTLSSNTTIPQTDVICEAERLLYFSKKQGLTMKLLGGLGIWFSSPSATRKEYSRSYHDLDFISHRSESSKVQKFFPEMGYSPRELFNKLQGGTRLMFLDAKNNRQVDVFLDEFAMSHKFNFKDRLDLCEKALHPSDLLITKLQIYEINRKDMIDMAALIYDVPVEFNKKGSYLDTERIAKICSEDWAVYKTITLNIKRMTEALPGLGLPREDINIVNGKLFTIQGQIEASPKSFRWKMRAKIGEKVRWYELPEEA